MPEPLKPAEVRGNEQKGHEEGRYGEQLAEDDYFLYGFETIEVGRDCKKNRRSSNADEKGEVGDVKTPGNLVPHAGYDQTPVHLDNIQCASRHDEDGQQEHPGVESGATLEHDAEETPEKVSKFFDDLFRALPESLPFVRDASYLKRYRPAGSLRFRSLSPDGWFVDS